MEKDEYDRAAATFERILDISGSLSTEARAVVYSESAVIQAFRKCRAAARTWEERASKFSRRQYLKHRVNSCIAFMDDDLDRAYDEAQLTSRAAAMDLENKKVREVFLKSWSRWIQKIEEKRNTKKRHSDAQSHVTSV